MKTLIVIIAIVVILIIIDIYYKKLRPFQSRINELEKETYRYYYLGDTIRGVSYEDRERIKKTLEKYNRLKEKFKDDVGMRLNFANDWRDYNHNICLKVNALDQYSDNARKEYLKEYKKKTKEIEEIEKRFDKLLKE